MSREKELEEMVESLKLKNWMLDQVLTKIENELINNRRPYLSKRWSREIEEARSIK
ncbi:hypothetical protein KEU06_08220 [Pseudaminobacter sp. 19-2017]|uniref:Uncharacterized protein n=1 Tax=Pseudaminobacter soli (ex Zhang et al. 2022) TaxID=2831468 RepID=A0A942DWX3_9HYPH|nr:hypothetical protein [Pseudaminobacter soli]MBS3648613.1 hypothetical protein [Pseudaminobacter soli]